MKKNNFILFLSFVAFQLLGAASYGNDFFYPDTTLTDTTAVYDSSAVSVADTLSDSLSTAKQRDLIFVKTIPLYDKGFAASYVNEEKKLHSDYRYIPELLELLPFAFYQDLGVTGQPGEMQLYGLGNGSISNSINSIQVNNRWKNSLNLYHIQTEVIDSIEYLPITSGFLYNTANNPVHVNYLKRNGVVKRPYSRIRFYQAPKEEGFLDILFNTRLFKSTYLLLQVSNTSIDRLVESSNNNVDFNNDFSLWNVESMVRYLFSDNINVELSYHHVKENTELYGGVKNNSLMFDEKSATLEYYDRNQRVTRNDFALTFNAEFIKNSPLNISAYYQYNLQEFNSNLDSIASDIPSFEDDNKYKTYGLWGRQVLRYGIFDLDLAGNYEHTVYTTELFGNVEDDNILSASSKLSLNLFDAINPSFYVKTSNYRKVQFNGFGAETYIKLNDNVNLFGGMSFVEKPFSIIENKFMSDDIKISKQKLNLIEIKAEYKSDIITGSLGYFYYKNDNMPVPVIDNSNDSIVVNEITRFETLQAERSGVNLNLSLKLWKILLTNNASYYLDNKTNSLNSLPEFSLRGGIYYVDTLFNSNLYLKAGLNYYITGKKSYVTYDFEKSLPVYYSSDGPGSGLNSISNEIVPLSKQLDLFVAGTIQENAIIYIVYENLLGENYYVVPYYPVYRQGLRIGVSWEFFD